MYSPLLADKNLVQPAKQQFIKQLDTKNYLLSGKYKDISIARRELDVLRHLVVGCTIKEVATLLKLSPRTVEGYFYNIKLKLGLYKKSEIIKVISEYDLF